MTAYLGKIVGAIAGLAIAGPIGAVVGAIIGHAFDHWRSRQLSRRRRPRAAYNPGPSGYEADASDPVFADPNETRRIAFATAIIVLGAKLAKADGVVTQEEIRAFKRTFRVDDRDVGDVGRIYNQARTTARGFEPYARQIAGLFGNDPILLEELLVGLFEVARADGELNPAEVDFLRRVAAIFGFSIAAFEQIRARFAATTRNVSTSDDAYDVLGIQRAAKDEQVKLAYRQLVREHHPDRLVSKGLPPELVEQANKRLAAINAAYDQIVKERGLR
ncbi:MAG: TerB family tellurite resistance protein [Geminicoccaceae bacterium]|nr:TerB family tellurite resistance protein [Geminicoccaceae bacterium]